MVQSQVFLYKDKFRTFIKKVIVKILTEPGFSREYLRIRNLVRLFKSL